MEQVTLQNENAAPSLLRQIVDEVDTMNELEKAELLRLIKWKKALYLAQKADSAFEGKFKPMSETEIADFVSNNRKRNYEKKIRN